ncbi:hypothetical protein PBRA_004016 [Plasmodiophora brassicae]|uniref:PCI domain-containing protein n=1 Tax=Plasmodiophora brassicae TaxID=37360 RepID=A0A0G4IJJ5_PLABS|nr:hypothetical protein PBRA_004016 [Plasmodiophora brassicae]
MVAADDVLAAGYEGGALLQRLRCQAQVSDDARSRFLDHVRAHTCNVALVASVASPGDTDLQGWIQRANIQLARKIDAAERAVADAKAAQDSNATRVALLKLAAVHSDSGDYKAALSKLLEARDVTTSLADKMDLALTIVVTSVNGDLWQNVRPEFAKASALKGSEQYGHILAIMKCAVGVTMFRYAQFSDAAATLLSVDEFPNAPYLFLPVDLVRYAVLAAMASYPRNALKDQLVNNAKFKPRLGMCRLTRQALTGFCQSKFADCLRSVDETLSDLTIFDPNVSSDIAKGLAVRIRESALCTYITPYESVSLTRMASAFGQSPSEIQSLLVKLIQKGTVAAKIDAQSQVLWASTTHQRKAAFAVGRDVAERFLTTGEALLLRVAQQRHNVIVGQVKSL